MPTATMPISETFRTMFNKLNSVRNVLVVSEKKMQRRMPTMAIVTLRLPSQRRQSGRGGPATPSASS